MPPPCVKARLKPWPEFERFRHRPAVLALPCWGCPVRRCTAWPTRPTPCGATPAGAGRAPSAATGSGLANGPRAQMTCSAGCRRASRAALLALVARGVSWPALRRDAAVTPSPNGGWPMGAMAQALGVHLVETRRVPAQPARACPAGHRCAACSGFGLQSGSGAGVACVASYCFYGGYSVAMGG